MATRIEKTDLARDALYDKVNTMIDEVNTKIDNKDSLPSQTGNAGKFLTTDGTNASWGKVKQIKIKQSLTNPSADTVPSTKAVSDESSRITTLMKTKVSNCITEIPQDIKLELNNGTLTLKAGSKVYVPNGDGVFDVKNITSDLTTTETGNDKYILTIRSDGNLRKWQLMNCFSGSTAPTGVQYPLWYDTTNNLMKTSQNGGQTWSSGDSFPLCIFTVSSGVITSIDQVFNGFGYIGSTVFALPGVKGRIPNGRNADGSLKNKRAILTGVQTTTVNSGNGSFSVRIGNNFIDVSVLTYDEKTNFNYSVSISPLNIRNQFNAGTISYSSGRITSFTPKTVFHALDYNDKSTISGWSMPSNRYINLTLGASGSNYIAPANGYFDFIHQGSNGQFLFLQNTSNIFEMDSVIYNQGFARVFIPCKKGDIINVVYNADGNITRLCFYYAEGEN